MFRRLLVPLDGSAAAETALAAAATLAARSGGEIRLLHVVDAPYGADYPEVTARAREAAAGYLTSVAQRPELSGQVSTAVRDGGAEEEIRREAEDWDADVIVMASHGRGGISRLWLGGVADRSLHRSPIPILLVRAGEDGVRPFQRSPRSVLVPLDGSLAAEAALPPAVALARLLDVPIELLRVVLPGDAWAFPVSDPNAGTVIRFEEAHGSARAYLDVHASRLRAAGVTIDARVEIDPWPAQIILDHGGFDPIVMTTRGQASRLERILLGRVADKVVRGAEGPVLMVQPSAP